MLQQQINYWTLREAMRHNRVTEYIGKKEATTNRMNAKSNRMNANTNIFNAKVNAINATSNRMLANAALSQAAAAHRQASAYERSVSVQEGLMPSQIWSNYLKPVSGVLSTGTSALVSGKGTKGGIIPSVGNKGKINAEKAIARARRQIAFEDGAAKVVPKAGIIAGVVIGVDTLKTVYDYVTDPNTNTDGLKAMNRNRR